MENMGLIVVPIGDYEPSKNVWDYGYPSGGNYWSTSLMRIMQTAIPLCIPGALFKCTTSTQAWVT